MASSYTTSFGIEKIGSGEQSGAWGDTTNHNIDILDRVASYKAVGLSGTTHTLTVREASPGSGTENLQDGMYRVIKFTGALGANNTVTVAPNTTAAFFIIINATTDSGSSGPYSVILTQGSGANITVTNGSSAVVYMDGAGSGAAVIDALSNLQLATLTASGDITSSGTLNALGDTAASDKAAIGYTAALGIIVTGQGSTNDITLVNDADATVLAVPTGTTNVDIVGVATAATFEPDGDTAAGDNAAIGYTAAEGLILTGQGSTNDVTIKNDADADVIEIPTGTVNVTAAGTLGVTGLITASAGVAATGNVTATGTVEPAGDTAAGDNAAIGYTAAEGLILTGQGSTNDVTIKNDADADVIEIPTGTTNVTVAGQFNGGTIILAETDTDTSNTGSVTIDFSAHQNFVLTLTGNVTLANPSTEAVGQAGVFVFIQDGTGSRTLSLGTDYETAASGGITLSTAAAAVDVVPYFVKASGSIQLGAPQLAFG
jgi:hypothetical protein